MTQQSNIGFFQGEDISLVDSIVDGNGAPVNITGWALQYVVDGTSIALTTAGGQVVITNGPGGVATTTIARALTKSLPLGGYPYHIDRTDSGAFATLSTGGFFLLGDQLLTSLPMVKLARNIPPNDTSQDFDTMVKLVAADAAIKRWCKRVLVQTNLPPEYPRGSIQPQLALRQRPLCVYPATGNLTQNSAVITNISPSTSKLIPGMPCVIGASWPGTTPLLTGSTILSVDSPTQVTLTNPAGVPVTQSGTAAPLAFGLAVWIDYQGGCGFGVGSGAGGPYNAGTELRIGIDFIPQINGSSGIAESGILVRTFGGPGASQGGGFWGDGFYGSVTSQRSTLTAGRVPGWPSGTYGETKVLYTAGYATVPPDLAQCAIDYTIALVRLTPMGGVWASSGSYQGFSYSLLGFSQDQKIADIRQRLTPFRELAV